jgi:hypothetical protein
MFFVVKRFAAPGVLGDPCWNLSSSGLLETLEAVTGCMRLSN